MATNSAASTATFQLTEQALEALIEARVNSMLQRQATSAQAGPEQDPLVEEAIAKYERLRRQLLAPPGFQWAFPSPTT